MPRTPPRAMPPVVEHRCLYCQQLRAPTEEPVFLCEACARRWIEYRDGAIALFHRAQRQPGHLSSILSKRDIAILFAYEHFRATAMQNFYPYVEQLRAHLEWEEQQARRKPAGRPRSQAHEWARTQVHDEGRTKREVFEEWRKKYLAEITNSPGDVDLYGLFKKVVKTRPATKRGGKKVRT